MSRPDPDHLRKLEGARFMQRIEVPLPDGSKVEVTWEAGLRDGENWAREKSIEIRAWNPDGTMAGGMIRDGADAFRRNR